MLVGFGYNAFEQLMSTTGGRRFISNPVPIFTTDQSQSTVDGNVNVVIQWSSIHLIIDHQVICSSKSCPCCLSKSAEDLLDVIDADLRGTAPACVITSTAGLVIVNEDGGRQSVALDVEDCTFKTVSVGDTHIIATKVDDSCGEVVYIDTSYIYQPFSLGKVCHVTCGKEHVLILAESGDVYSYGIGSRGQLGHGQPDTEKAPRVVEALQGVRMSAVSCGGWHSAALSGIGDVYIWGWNESGQLGFPMKPKPMLTTQNKKPNTKKDSYKAEPYCERKAGEESSRKSGEIDMKLKHGESEHETHSPNINRIKSSNKLSSPLKTEKINDNEASCSQRGDSSTHQDVAIQFAMIPSLLDFPGDINVSKVSCGSRHSAAVLENGELYTWGWGNYGQLGHGNTETVDQPTHVAKLNHKHRVIDVTCGAWNTVAVCESLPSHCQSLDSS